MYLAIDPGKTTGFAHFDPNSEIVINDKIKGEDAFLDFLEKYLEVHEIKVFIVEAYRNRPGPANKHNVWSKNETSQHIGAIKRIARKAGITVVEQEPSPCLAIGLKFLDMDNRYKGKHVPDEISALAHGTYYLKKNGILT